MTESTSAMDIIRAYIMGIEDKLGAEAVTQWRDSHPNAYAAARRIDIRYVGNGEDYEAFVDGRLVGYLNVATRHGADGSHDGWDMAAIVLERPIHHSRWQVLRVPGMRLDNTI